jgi:predicted FMN-binding regulatory protein PaiB
MNKPVVSRDALERLEETEQDKAVERLMRKHGFTGADLTYEEIDGKRKLLMNKKVVDYIKTHENIMKSEIQKAMNAASIKALEAGAAIIELQKMGGKR